MREPTSTTRYRAAIAMLAIAVSATGMAGVGLLAAQAAPHGSAQAASGVSPGDPAAAPAIACPVPIPLPGVCDSASPTATTTSSSTATSSTSPSPSSSCPLPIPLPGLCDSSSPSSSASPSASTTASPSASSTTTATSTATSSAHPTPSSSASATPAQQPTVYFTRQKATKKHPARLLIKLVANGSLITDLLDVQLKHCTWSLGSAKAKHYKGGRHKLWIYVTRKHKGTKGSIRFRMVDAAGQKTLVRSHV
jgi:hypothetical protein